MSRLENDGYFALLFKMLSLFHGRLNNIERAIYGDSYGEKTQLMWEALFYPPETTGDKDALTTTSDKDDAVLRVYSDGTKEYV